MKNSHHKIPADFEGRMERLQAIVNALEDGRLSLEEGMALYREGVECSRLCREQLEKARHQLTVWQDGEEREMVLTDTASGSLPDEEDDA
ncbi:exodeoxyribonuclease VII small subunit [uncultured Desulfovibrio sp.]|uniref:exodeoxyribonuclease VII small subunit n=1 Tax=uncultured Desulfovibrio sp. TaxID=167968 RepID=UPI00262983BD|nr:exodeoxyribonuclease VII small subunit [uncultured Desulfovibrio sp.]